MFSLSSIFSGCLWFSRHWTIVWVWEWCCITLLLCFFLYLNMAHSHSRSLLMTPFWYLFWTPLLHHWLENPWISIWKGIPLNALFTLFAMFWVRCILFFLPLYFRHLNPYPFSWFTSLDLFRMIGCVCSDLSLRRDGYVWVYYSRSMTLVDEMYTWVMLAVGWLVSGPLSIPWIVSDGASVQFIMLEILIWYLSSWEAKSLSCTKMDVLREFRHLKRTCWMEDCLMKIWLISTLS